MVPHIVLLAAMRLAPLQAAGWGHPVTTGLVNVDLFLSSDAMEPADGAAHYTEDLVRLPGLSVSVAAPELAGLAPDRTALGLSPDRPVLLACQSPIKFRPQDDPMFAAIARRAPETLIAFVAHSSEHVNDRFADRLERAFREAGLDWRRHCVVVPRTDRAGWLRLNLSCDVFLDSLGWSGGMTTLEAIACGLPVVTCPGGTMRARHTAAMLQLMGLDATIAADVDAYVDLAAALLTDPAKRAAAAATIADRRATLYDDPAPVAALGDALATHLERRRATAERT